VEFAAGEVNKRKQGNAYKAFDGRRFEEAQVLFDKTHVRKSPQHNGERVLGLLESQCDVSFQAATESTSTRPMNRANPCNFSSFAPAENYYFLRFQGSMDGKENGAKPS
jgi:hypothetical protein